MPEIWLEGDELKALQDVFDWKNRIGLPVDWTAYDRAKARIVSYPADVDRFSPLLNASTPPPGRVMWTLTKETHTLRCEVRNDAAGAGVDCQVLWDGEFAAGQHCDTEAGAEFFAASLRRDYLRRGWFDAENPFAAVKKSER